MEAVENSVDVLVLLLQQIRVWRMEYCPLKDGIFEKQIIWIVDKSEPFKLFS